MQRCNAARCARTFYFLHGCIAAAFSQQLISSCAATGSGVQLSTCQLQPFVGCSFPNLHVMTAIYEFKCKCKARQRATCNAHNPMQHVYCKVPSKVSVSKPRCSTAAFWGLQFFKPAGNECNKHSFHCAKLLHAKRTCNIQMHKIRFAARTLQVAFKSFGFHICIFNCTLLGAAIAQTWHVICMNMCRKYKPLPRGTFT